MNKVAQRIADILGSVWVIGGFGIWLVVHNMYARDYVTFISDLAIEIGLLILRAEKVQNDQMQRDVKRDLSESKKILSKLGG